MAKFETIALVLTQFQAECQNQVRRPSLLEAELTIGIIGGGQLARMMALESSRMGLSVRIYCESYSDPAAQIQRDVMIGSLADIPTLRAFLQSVDVCTFESEFVDLEVLKKASETLPVQFHPAIETMDRIQDRLPQKILLDSCGLPTARWFEVSNEKAAREAYRSLNSNRKSGVVFKQRRLGYDGYGTVIVRSEQELDAFLTERMHLQSSGWIAEELIPFHSELAVTFIRDREGNIGRFPVVETKQADSRCLWVKGPYPKRPELNRVLLKAHQMLAEIRYVGAMTLELFRVKQGPLGRATYKVLVNEVAPRVHNSCHYSLNAYSLNQFSGHLLACSSDSIRPALKEIGSTQTFRGGFAMANLLGTREVDRLGVQVANHPIGLSPDRWIHWYGKHESRKGRKLGHVTVLSASPKAALRSALKQSQCLQQKWGY